MNDSRVANFKRATLICAALIAISTFGWQLANFSAWRVVVALILCTPLLIPLRGLILGRRYTFRWATFCALPYLVIATTELVAQGPDQIWMYLMLSGASGFFIALIGYLRVTSSGRE